MQNKEIVDLIKGDFYRVYADRLSMWKIVSIAISRFGRYPGWMLFFRYAQSDIKLVCIIAKIFLRVFSYLHCIDIPSCTKIGKGFYMGHGMCIVIHGGTQIGNNVNVSQFVNIGSNTSGFPVIGNNVYIGPHVSIVGNVTIGDNVTIGAGAVVVKDVPSEATVVGVPAHVVNYDNPARYICNRV